MSLASDIKDSIVSTAPLIYADAQWTAIANGIAQAIIANLGVGGVVPSGTISMSGQAAAPTGWLLCDGAAVSRTTYADLFTALGTTFGSGNGTSTFNLPDFRGVFPKGAGTTDRAAGKDASGNAYAGANGTYATDQFQSWQLGAAADASGARNYYSYATARDYVQGATAFATLTPIANATGGQGNAARFKAMDDGTNGAPRTGHTTEPQSLGITFIIKT